MKTTYLQQLLGVLILLHLATCASDTPPSTSPTTVDSSQVFEKGGDYYQMKGQLGEYAVTMELRLDPILAKEGHYLGFYRYDRFGGPIGLHGYQDSLGMLTLTEEGSFDNKAHQLVGRFDPTEGFVGEWYSGNGQDVLSFELLPNDSNLVQLEQWHYQDSLLAFPGFAASPQMTYDLSWLIPTEEQLSRTQLLYLRKAIAQGLLGQTDSKAADKLEDLVLQQRTKYLADYRTEMANYIEEGIIDTSKMELHDALYHYAHSTSMQVYYNAWPLLTVGYTDYDYQGGAHGMYGTRVATYDVERARQLKLEDVLKPGYEEPVGQVLANAIRLKYNLAANQPLSAILFDDAVQPNANFGLTDKGIFFVFPPYEIAPYAAGEIELFVAFERIQEVVQEAWLPQPEATL
ncbi:MAG: DUF3298 domain-containing protein [Bacteroidota bacterium]